MKDNQNNKQSCNSIEELVSRYEANRDYYLSPKYNETQLRNEFLDVFFELLGWDIKNVSGKSISERATELKIFEVDPCIC